MTFGYGQANIADTQEATAQKVMTRLYLLRGEWFLDTDAGVPYTQQIGGVKPAPLQFTEAILKQTILETEGVAEILTFELQLNNQNRVASVTATVATIYGTTENIKVRL
jgi:hypothetical protein